MIADLERTVRATRSINGDDGNVHAGRTLTPRQVCLCRSPTARGTRRTLGAGASATGSKKACSKRERDLVSLKESVLAGVIAGGHCHGPFPGA